MIFADSSARLLLSLPGNVFNLSSDDLPVCFFQGWHPSQQDESWSESVQSAAWHDTFRWSQSIIKLLVDDELDPVMEGGTLNTRFPAMSGAPGVWRLLETKLRIRYFANVTLRPSRSIQLAVVLVAISRGCSLVDVWIFLSLFLLR